MWQGFHLLESHKETHEKLCLGQFISLLAVWRGIHLQEPPKETQKDSISLCSVWQGIYLQEPPEETHEETFRGDSISL